MPLYGLFIGCDCDCECSSLLVDCMGFDVSVHLAQLPQQLTSQRTYSIPLYCDCDCDAKIVNTVVPYERGFKCKITALQMSGTE